MSCIGPMCPTDDNSYPLFHPMWWRERSDDDLLDHFERLLKQKKVWGNKKAFIKCGMAEIMDRVHLKGTQCRSFNWMFAMKQLEHAQQLKGIPDFKPGGYVGQIQGTGQDLYIIPAEIRERYKNRETHDSFEQRKKQVVKLMKKHTIKFKINPDE